MLEVAAADARVPLLKVAAGMDGALVAAAVAAGVRQAGHRGNGVGHVPASWMPPLREALAAGVPVLIATRTGSGPVRAEYGGPGGGFDLQDAGALLAGRRSGLAARIELICALGAGLRGEALRTHFAGA